MVSPDDSNRTDVLKLILYDLNSAIAPRDVRLMAIHAALEEFDHDDEVLHDEELELRADHILLQKLTYAMCIDPNSVEVGYICSAMEAVYRTGRNRLAQSFHEICDSLLPLFVEMIRPPAGYEPAWMIDQDEAALRLSKGASEMDGVAGVGSNVGGSASIAGSESRYSEMMMTGGVASSGATPFPFMSPPPHVPQPHHISRASPAPRTTATSTRSQPRAWRSRAATGSTTTT